MLSFTDPSRLARLLPGEWAVGATNLPQWRGDPGRSARLRYELVQEQPLVLLDDITWTSAEGAQERSPGTSAWAGDGFSRRGPGVQRFFPTRWQVRGVDDSVSAVALSYDRGFRTPSGLAVLVRTGSTPPDLRRIVAERHDEFGLSLEDFAALAWL